MKKLTQEEFDAMTRDERGYINIPDETDCTGVNFYSADKIIFGSYCELGNWCTLGNDCTLGNRCTLGDGCKLGNGCTLGNRCELGNWCTLGNDCTLGNRCTLGDGCKLGNGCTLGEYCNVRAMFESGRVKNGLYVQVGNIGREHRTAYFYIDERGAMFVRAGCWFSGMDDFKTRVHSVHGGTLYEAQYIAACRYAEAVLPLMLKADDERMARNGKAEA